MLAIRDLKTNKYFCEKHTKIILFDNIDDANYFINLFINYSMNRAAQENALDLIFQIMDFSSQLTIDEITDLTKLKEYVIFNEIKTKRGYK